MLSTKRLVVIVSVYALVAQSPPGVQHGALPRRSLSHCDVKRAQMKFM